MKYHISTRGEPVKCTASVKTCPREHYETEGDALVAVEQSMMGSRAESLKAAQQEALFEVQQVLKGTRLKDMNTAELTQTLLYEGQEAGLDPDTLKSATGFASVLHSEQKRGARGRHDSTPYIEHPLRNSIRLIRMGVRDQDVIAATLLHDTVEDCAPRYTQKFLNREMTETSAREELSSKIRATYGPEVQRLVMAVTNPYLSPSAKRERTPEAKRTEYASHVRENIKGDARAYLVKISDFFDNASSLHHSDKPGSGVKVAGRAAKYLPVVQIFRDEGKMMDLGLSKKASREMSERLSKTEERLKAIVAKYS